MSIPAEILKKIKRLEINTRKLVNSIFAGQYHSAFKGQGMTFSDFREYVPGDDVRNISWNLTARTGKTFIKKYEEERELTLMLVVDVSGSVDFGANQYFKGEVMTHLAAILGFSASKNNDNVGLLLFSDQVEHFVPPKKGRGHVQRILRDLYYHKPKSKNTNIAEAVTYLTGILKKRATIFVVSDYFDSSEYGQHLKRLSRKHEVVAICVNDPIEEKFPELGLIDLYDPEEDTWRTVDTSSWSFQKEFKQSFSDLKKMRKEEFKKARVEVIEVNNDDDFVDPLAAYFRKRNKR